MEKIMNEDDIKSCSKHAVFYDLEKIEYVRVKYDGQSSVDATMEISFDCKTPYKMVGYLRRLRILGKLFNKNYFKLIGFGRLK